MTKIARLSGINIGSIGSLQTTDTFRGKDISIMTEGELFTHLVERQLELKVKYRPTTDRKILLEQLQQINSNVGVHGIDRLAGYDKAIQEIIAYAQHNPQAALGAGIGAIDQVAIRRACDNRIPAPESAVPWVKRQQLKLKYRAGSRPYEIAIKEYHNENLGRYGFLNACFNADMKQQIINDYFEQSGSALMYKVTDDSELSDRALTKKGFQGLYGNSLKRITGISDTNMNQFIVNGIAADFEGRDSVDVVRVLRGDAIGEPITAATVLLIAKIIAAVAAAAGAIGAALADAEKVEGWENMQSNLPVLDEVTPNDSDFGGNNNNGNGNGNDEEGNPLMLPLLIGGGGLGLAYAFGLFD